LEASYYHRYTGRTALIVARAGEVGAICVPLNILASMCGGLLSQAPVIH